MRAHAITTASQPAAGIMKTMKFVDRRTTRSLLKVTRKKADVAGPPADVSRPRGQTIFAAFAPTNSRRCRCCCWANERRWHRFAVRADSPWRGWRRGRVDDIGRQNELSTTHRVLRSASSWASPITKMKWRCACVRVYVRVCARVRERLTFLLLWDGARSRRPEGRKFAVRRANMIHSPRGFVRVSNRVGVWRGGSVAEAGRPIKGSFSADYKRLEWIPKYQLLSSMTTERRLFVHDRLSDGRNWYVKLSMVFIT